LLGLEVLSQGFQVLGVLDKQTPGDVDTLGEEFCDELAVEKDKG
jgi:hypothetical protein